MKLVNLTPHVITLILGDNKIEVPPSGEIARCAVERKKVDEIQIAGIAVPINKTEFGKIENLPEPQDSVIYVVSALVAQAAKRSDVLMVDDTVRDERGRIIGARALAQV